MNLEKFEQQKNDNLTIAVSVFHALFGSLGENDKKRFMSEVIHEFQSERQEELQFMSAGLETFLRDESPDDAIYDNYHVNKIIKK